MYNARVTVRDADGNAEKRWLKNDAEYCDVLRGEFGLNISVEEIKECIEVMKRKGTGELCAPVLLLITRRRCTPSRELNHPKEPGEMPRLLSLGQFSAENPGSSSSAMPWSDHSRSGRRCVSTRCLRGQIAGKPDVAKNVRFGVCFAAPRYR